jgi:hypothetical protein
MSVPEGVGPSNLPRQGRLTQAGYHRDGVWCVLFGKVRGQENALLIGKAKQQTGDQRQLRNHAEQLWWDDESNLVALRNAALRADFEWFEFEVTRDFCAQPDPSDPTGRPPIRPCRDRFKKAREIVPVGKKIYIFIMRALEDGRRVYYEVADNYGFVREQRGGW